MSRAAFTGYAIFSACLFLICATLGIWQWQRHVWKAGLLAEADEAAAVEPIKLPATNPDLESTVSPFQVYSSFLVTGRFLDQKDIIIRGFAVDGVSGSRLYAPFEMNDGRVLIVRRGWAVRGAEESSGVFDTRAQTIEVLWREVQARASDRSLFAPVNVPELEIWAYIDPVALAEHWGLPNVIPGGYGELRTAERPGSALYIEAFRADLFNRHLEYVFTWWALALVTLGMFGAVWWGRRKRR